MAVHSAVSVKSLTKRFGSQVTALNEVSFEIPPQSLYGLLGPNGAGKTTLFSIAANFLQATSGTIEVLGIDVRNISQLRGRFSMLPQDALFARNVPVVEQMVTFCLLNGQPRHEAEATAKRSLEQVGLGDAMTRAASKLSHGMSKRMALAQAFLGNPEVVFLDEPTSGLDPQNAAHIRQLVRDMSKSCTVVISSHNLAELQDMCTHCAIMDHGKIVSTGEMSDILGSAHTVNITFGKPLSSEFVNKVADLPSVENVGQPKPERLSLSLNLPEGASKDDILGEVLQVANAHGYIPRTITEGTQLEERFLEMTGGTGDGLGST